MWQGIPLNTPAAHVITTFRHFISMILLSCGLLSGRANLGLASGYLVQPPRSCCTGPDFSFVGPSWRASLERARPAAVPVVRTTEVLSRLLSVFPINEQLAGGTCCEWGCKEPQEESQARTAIDTGTRYKFPALFEDRKSSTVAEPRDCGMWPIATGDLHRLTRINLCSFTRIWGPSAGDRSDARTKKNHQVGVR